MLKEDYQEYFEWMLITIKKHTFTIVVNIILAIVFVSGFISGSSMGLFKIVVSFLLAIAFNLSLDYFADYKKKKRNSSK